MSSLSYARLNLRRNPFGEPPADERWTLFVGSLGDWPAFLNGKPNEGGPGSAGRGPGSGPRLLQLLGPSGCGKSTLLEALRENFPKAPLVTWCAVGGWQSFPKAGSGPVFVDDAQELSPRQIRGLRRFWAVAVATQEDLGVFFGRMGFQVRTERVERRMRFPGLLEMVERRLEWARRGPGPVPRVDEGALRFLFQLHRDDLRSIQSHLYDWYQRLEAGE